MPPPSVLLLSEEVGACFRVGRILGPSHARQSKRKEDTPRNWRVGGVQTRLCFPCADFPSQEFGVSAADIKKLHEGGICTIEGLVRAPRKDLVSIKGMSEAKVEKLQKEGESLGSSCLLPPSIHPPGAPCPAPGMQLASWFRWALLPRASSLSSGAS